MEQPVNGFWQDVAGNLVHGGLEDATRVLVQQALHDAKIAPVVLERVKSGACT